METWGLREFIGDCDGIRAVKSTFDRRAIQDCGGNWAYSPTMLKPQFLHPTG
jgi:hypothetical protein